MDSTLSSVGVHLKNLVQLASFGGLFFSLSSTLFVWAGSDSFQCSSIIWKSILAIGLALFVLIWIVYLPFRNSDRLVGHGILSILIFFNLFLLFGFSMFYFYFIFAPINIWVRLFSTTGISVILLYHAAIIALDIRSTFKNRRDLFDKIYCSADFSYSYKRSAFELLKNSRIERNPFKSFYGYVALFLTPFLITLNRLLSPLMGDGHGVFLILAFFSVPIMFWGTEFFVQTFLMTIYYPLKLERLTGKLVLLKDW